MKPKLYYAKSHAHKSVKDYDRKSEGKFILDGLGEGNPPGSTRHGVESGAGSRSGLQDQGQHPECDIQDSVREDDRREGEIPTDGTIRGQR